MTAVTGSRQRVALAWGLGLAGCAAVVGADFDVRPRGDGGPGGAAGGGVAAGGSGAEASGAGGEAAGSAAGGASTGGAGGFGDCTVPADCGADTTCRTFGCDAAGACTVMDAGRGTPCTEMSGSFCDGAGTCAACGTILPAVGGACPPECTGGCNVATGTCTIACDSVQACQVMTITCPSGFHCLVNCQDVQSCQGAVVECPSGHACGVDCLGDQSCQTLQLMCADGPCTLGCSVNGACESDTTVVCGPDRCAATCVGGEQPMLSCGPSCSCEPC